MQDIGEETESSDVADVIISRIKREAKERWNDEDLIDAYVIGKLTEIIIEGTYVSNKFANFIRSKAI